MDSREGRRRLATILATDAVGYSKLMAENEEATVRTLQSHRTIIDRLIARHEGRIFSSAGDATLAEFDSAVEAVRCAISIQDELRVRNAELVADRQMLFRIGINVGDVIVNGDDLLGDGVNIAARLEGVAQPGGVCISGSTFEQVKNKLSVRFDDLGPQQVKNIPEPISAFSITSAPVTVASRDDTATVKTPAANRRNLRVAFGAAIVLLVVAGGIGYWQYSDTDAMPLRAFPKDISTDEMRAGEIAAFMTGMKISGIRKMDGLPYTIVLNADMTASYQYPRSGELRGTVERKTGKWFTKDFRFCLKVPGFGYGKKLCPRIEKNGSKLTVRRRDNGNLVPWSLSK